VERGIRSRFGGRSLRGKGSLGLALAAALTLAFSVGAQAAVTDAVDQSQTLTLSAESVGQDAQTFTAGVTGRLDRVSLYSSGAAFGTVQIQTVTGTFPAGLVVGSATFSGSYVRGFHDVAFAPPIAVTAGSRYAIVVKSFGRSVLTWYTSGGVDNYAGGQAYIGCLGCSWVTDPRFGADFAFETWVIGGASVNQPPVVAADNSTVTVNEGTAPVNSGSFSDPDSDTVVVTASTGTVTQTGSTSAGSWSWTAPASDEPSNQTVTIKADDGHGLTTTVNFAAVTTGVAPTVSISRAASGVSAAALTTGTSFSSPEGTAVSLNGAATSPSAEDTAAGFAYSWTVTKDGSTFGTGSAAAFTFTPNDEGTYVATLLAKDDGGMTGTTSVTVTGANVAPAAKITAIAQSAPLVLTANESLSFSGSFSDPGALDSHTATWSFGDGATSTTSFGPGGSAGLSATHSYGAAGTFAVTLTVTDDDGGVGQSTSTVHVQTAQQALTSICSYVQGLKTLNAGQRNSLIVKCNAAGDSIARGNTTAANNQLNAFLNELQADLGTGKISGGDAATLRGAVHAVQAAMGTYNRLLEWALGA
jgi:PKD domain/Bacterial Ig domain